jgi:hypothetical protein
MAAKATGSFEGMSSPVCTILTVKTPSRHGRFVAG